MTVTTFDAVHPVVRFCAIECWFQMSGERSVSWMFDAWTYAMDVNGFWMPEDILTLGRLVEPVKNADGYRRCGVRVGASVKGPWEDVPRLMEKQLGYMEDAQAQDAAAEWFRQYEEIHPWVDGNGRTGAILFNWLNDSMLDPEWPPNFWDDPRRFEGCGVGRLGDKAPASREDS